MLIAGVLSAQKLRPSLRRGFPIFHTKSKLITFSWIQTFVSAMSVIVSGSTKVFQIMLHGFDNDDAPKRGSPANGLSEVRSMDGHSPGRSVRFGCGHEAVADLIR